MAAPGGSYKYEGRYGDEYAVYSTLPGNAYGYMQGTSMACPHVSGIAALAVAKYGGPGFTPDKLRSYLERGVHEVDSYNPDYEGRLGSGLVDAYLAVSMDRGIDPDPVADLRHSDTAGEVELTWSVPADGDDGRADSFILMWRVGTLENPDPDNLPEGAESVVIPVRDKQAGDEITYVLTDIAEQTRYTVAIVAVDPWGNRSETTVISFGTPANTPPALILESTEEVRVGYNRTETVRYHVSDPDSHGFTCELQDPSGAVAIRKEGDRLCLDIFNYKRIPGNYTAHVSVSDSFGASDTADFDFTLLPDQPPVATGGFRPVYLGSMQETAEFTPSQGFDDEVPGTVAYALEYDEEMLYLQPVASGYRIMPLCYGRSEVTVVATDEGGLAGRDTFAVMCRDDSREVDLYPNPVRDRLSIRMGRDVEGALRVTLYDAAGTQGVRRRSTDRSDRSRRSRSLVARGRNLYDRTAIRRRFAHALHRQTLKPEKMQSFFRNILIAAALLAVPLAGTAQNAAAFLSVVPDARSAAMGGAGVALSADVFSALRNAARCLSRRSASAPVTVICRGCAT